MSTLPYRIWMALRLLFATRARHFHSLAADYRVAAFDAGIRRLLRDVDRERCKEEAVDAQRRAMQDAEYFRRVFSNKNL